jgi:hypothetical protein
VGSMPGVVMVLGELEPPQPKRKRRLAKAKIDGMTRIDESSNRYSFSLEQYMIVIVIVNLIALDGDGLPRCNHLFGHTDTRQVSSSARTLRAASHFIHLFSL